MRIIGGHDYYDSALAYGQDSDVIFVRNTKVFKASETPLYACYPSKLVGDNYFEIPGLGKVEFRAISVYIADRHYGGVSINQFDQIIETFWNYDRFMSWAMANKISINTTVPRQYVWEPKSEIKDAFLNLKSWFIPHLATDVQREWLISNNIAIAVWHDKYSWHTTGSWYCNSPNLKGLGFAKAVDPYTLFQELSMWVGGILPQAGNEMVEITDQKIKAHKAGFDKWSFRRHKDDNK